MKNNSIAAAIFIIILLGGFLGYNSAYVVDETEQVVITQFGRVIGETIYEPGLKFKLPFIQKALVFKKNLQHWDGDKGQIPTEDKTYLWVDTFAFWKIKDPVKYFQSVGTRQGAISRLDDILDAAVRNAVTSNPLVETVRWTNRELDKIVEREDTADINTGRKKIEKSILLSAQPKLDEFGIELVEVQFKRINYVSDVRNSVYKRMIAERNQIAEKFRSEGRGKSAEIIGQKEKELEKIRSEAYEKAQALKGQADAEVTKIFAKAYGVDPEFYSFIESMDIYKEKLASGDTKFVFSTNSDFLKYLKGLEKF
ncbi:MAG: protease modulator HflC [Desulforegulaceae bacterium]|jgi:membrane protease subunit HflC|nr:protease modulator HflC [Desulforegulaceae bacterium]